MHDFPPPPLLLSLSLSVFWIPRMTFTPPSRFLFSNYMSLTGYRATVNGSSLFIPFGFFSLHFFLIATLFPVVLCRFTSCNHFPFGVLSALVTMSSLSFYLTHSSFTVVPVGRDPPSYFGVLYDIVGEPYPCTITLIYITISPLHCKTTL